MLRRLARHLPRLSPAPGPAHGETPARAADPPPPETGAVALAPPNHTEDSRPAFAGTAGSALRLAVLGDSSAAGFGAPDHATALAGQLAVALAALLDRQVSWRVSARGGATARTAPTLIDRLTVPGWAPDLVLLVVGVNDTTRLRRPAAYQRDVARLIIAVRDHLGAQVPVLLAGLPPVGRFPAIPTPIRQLLGAHARRLDRRLGLLAQRFPGTHHLPVGNLPLNRPGLFAPDGFHPAPPAYRVWGRLLAAQSADLLEPA